MSDVYFGKFSYIIYRSIPNAILGAYSKFLTKTKKLDIKSLNKLPHSFLIVNVWMCGKPSISIKMIRNLIYTLKLSFVTA